MIMLNRSDLTGVKVALFFIFHQSQLFFFDDEV